MNITKDHLKLSILPIGAIMFLGFGLYDGERHPLCDTRHDHDLDCVGEPLRTADPEMKSVATTLSYVGFFIILAWVIIFFYETKKRGYV